MKSKWTKILLILLLISIGIAGDQVTKWAASNYLKDQGTVQVVGDFFILNFVENNGAFLGLGSNWPLPLKLVFLTSVPLIFLVVLLAMIFKTKEMNLLQIIAFCGIISGGMSNLYDRIFNHGFVVDFMNMGIGKLRTGVFNLADMCILFGAIILVLVSDQGKKQEKEETAKL
jgi:signal peptidase II